MKIWVRLSLVVSTTIVIGVVLFAAAAYFLFVRAQETQLRELLLRDLNRIQDLVSDPVLGAPALRGDEPGFVAQFVSRDGSVVLPANGGPPLPIHLEPTIDHSGPVPRMAVTAAWNGPGDLSLGTIRVAIDISDALRTRRTLARVLFAAGIGIAIVVSLAAVMALRRATRPLSRLAARARTIDPARPESIEYRGPDDEVAELAAALDESLAAIRRRQEAERAVLAEVAHELAAPLSVVAGQIRSFAAVDPDDERLQAAHRAAQELLHTSQDLLALGRGELDQVLELQIVNVSDVVREVAQEYPGLVVHASEPAEVVGDPLRLKQMVRNLVRNAVQASGGPEEVACSVRAEDAKVRILVEDRGPGIPPEEQPRVFERFYGTRGGAGVGLAVVKRIVERHQGSITVASQPGLGTRFEVTLPDVASQIVGEDDPRTAER